MSTSASNSPPFIVAFYDPSIRKRDAEGRTLDNILHFSDDELEYHHDFIQYLFPLPERSPINPHAPVVTLEVRREFLARAELREALTRALGRMLEFYGFETAISPASAPADEGVEREDNDLSISPAAHFAKASRNTWRTRFDHNHLRITRIIRSLRVLGLEKVALAFRAALVENDSSQRVSERTLMFWERAVRRPLRLSPEEGDDDAEGVGWLREEEEAAAAKTGKSMENGAAGAEDQ